MSDTISEIKEQIKKAEVAARNDDSYNNTALNNLYKLKLSLQFAELEDPNIVISRDYVVIDDKYIATLSGVLKWRVRGKNVWYYYSSHLDLVHKVRRTSC
jgi:hypothetical protein